MSVVIRLLIVVGVVVAAIAVAYFVDRSLGIEQGTWQYTTSIVLVGVATGIALRNVFRKRPRTN